MQLSKVEMTQPKQGPGKNFMPKDQNGASLLEHQATILCGYVYSQKFSTCNNGLQARLPYLFNCVSHGLKFFHHFVWLISLHQKQLTLFFCLIKRYRWHSVFLWLQFLNQTFFSILLYLQHQVHIRHKRNYDERKAFAVVQASLPGLSIKREMY